MKRFIAFFTIFLSVFTAVDAFAATRREMAARCKGRIRVVEHGADFRVRIVTEAPDLYVYLTYVGSVVDPGEWEFVENGEDFTVEFVFHAEDFSIKFSSQPLGLN